MNKILIDEALRLADCLTDRNRLDLTCDEAAAELRLLHEVNAALLEALEDLLHQAKFYKHEGGWDFEQARAAIAKATGEMK